MSLRKIQQEAQHLIQQANPYAGREGLVYARVSSKRQERDGHGLDSQEGRCISDLGSIKVRHHKTFLDSFSGGGDFMKRPAIREMLGYIDANPHNRFVVVFDDLKRFARDVKFHFELKTAFKARDVLLRCLNYSFDESPEGQFAELIMAGQAELERHQNRRQVIQKMKERLERGYWPFAGRRGYDMVADPLHGKVHKPNKEGRTTLKEALEGFASGNLMRKVDVARFMFERSFWKGSKRTPEHYIDEVSVILGDIFHAGYIEYPKWGVTRRKGKHVGVISLDTYERIYKRLKKEVAGSRIRVDLSSDFPLRGLIVCPECKKKLTAAPSKGRSKTYLYYYCQNKGCSSYSKMFRKEDVESDFKTLLRNNQLKTDVGEVVQLMFDRIWKEEVRKFKQKENSKEQRVRDLREKIRGLSDLARAAHSDTLRWAYEEQIEEVARELEGKTNPDKKQDLNVPYRTALSKSTGMLKSPITIWDKVDVLEKHRLFFFLFEARLAYTKGEGYRTGDALSSTRLFEEFCDQNSDDVDQRGIEPPTFSLQMRRSTTELLARRQVRSTRLIKKNV